MQTGYERHSDPVHWCAVVATYAAFVKAALTMKVLIPAASCGHWFLVRYRLFHRLDDPLAKQLGGTFRTHRWAEIISLCGSAACGNQKSRLRFGFYTFGNELNPQLLGSS